MASCLSARAESLKSLAQTASGAVAMTAAALSLHTDLATTCPHARGQRGVSIASSLCGRG